MEAELIPKDQPCPLFDGSITIKSLPANPDPNDRVLAECTLDCSGTASGFGQALGVAARAFMDSLPAEFRNDAGRNVLGGFLTVLGPGGAEQVQHGGLNS